MTGKIVIAYLPIFFFCVINAQTQNVCNPVITDQFGNNEITRSYNSPLLVDKIHLDSFNSVTSKRIIGENREVTSITYQFNSPTDSVPSLKEVNLYDQEGNLIESVLYNWRDIDNGWRPRWKYLTWYDQNSGWYLKIWYGWDNKNQNWFLDRMEEMDKSDTLTVFTCSYWNMEMEDWVYQCRNEHYYNNEGIPYSTVQKSWELSINDWVTYYYYELVYDEYGEKQTIRYRYDSLVGDYIPWYKYERIGTDLNPRLEEYYEWDNILKSWVLLEKNEIHYDYIGNVLLFINYCYNSISDEWFVIRRYEQDFNDQSSIVSYESLYWDESGSISYSNKENTYYLDNGDIGNKISYSWDEMLQDWVLRSKTYYNYSSDDATKIPDNLVIYPNPTSSIVQILGIRHESNVGIYSLSGELIYEGLVNRNQIDLSNLNSGIYILTFVDAENGTIKKKIIKQ